mmetsp:Transcript_39941/g.106000  ORF Transcript_39941/g.106000 Transcript_39941/m.106000 type:complete len:165 (-) Transcript_39941:32-526(-)
MADKKLPLRAVKETLFSGCSKKRSTRLLPEFALFEIPHQFPAFPQIFGQWIVRRIRKNEAGLTRDHPCSKAFDSFLDCARRCPTTLETKCKVEAGRCLQCLEDHKEWKAPQAYNYMRFLEHFRIFTEGKGTYEWGRGKFRYSDRTPDDHGRGTVLQFQNRSPKR